MDSNREPAECDSTIPSDKTTPAPTSFPEPAVPQTLLEHGRLDESMQISAQDSGYNSSGSSAHNSSAEILSGGAEDSEHILTRSRATSRTSVSSIPASILTNLPDGMKPMNMCDMQDYSFQSWGHHGSRSAHTIRQREAMFRKPSSVRAMQMHTEDEQDYEYLTPPKRRSSQRTPDLSVRSGGSLPFKRSPFYSPTGAAGKPKVKKEYPLVLLHCTLLSPSLPVAGLVGHPDRQKILNEVLPSVYWKRWKLLEEKVGSGLLRDRGVLISHPEDMYDLLEERLLESLELQHPRLDHGHFLGRDETESDREDRLAREDNSTEDEGDGCPDCGGRVVRHNTARKWEVKVFAANGLMRAGAWAAAWKEMEKVDVEVGLWLPLDVRAELEKRLAEDSSQIDTALPTPLLQEPENMSVRTSTRVLTQSPPETDPTLPVTQHYAGSPSPISPRARPQDDRKWDSRESKPLEEIDLQTLMVNYVRVLANDRRNIAVALLSILVIFFAINSRPVAPASDWQRFPGYIPEHTTLSVVPLQESATQTWTESTVSQTLSLLAVPEPSTAIASSADPGTPSSPDDVSDAPVEYFLDEPEQIPPIATDNLSVESAKFVSEEQEEPTLSENEPEEALPTIVETPSADSIHVLPEEEEVPQASEAVLLEAPLSTAVSMGDAVDDQAVDDQHNQNEQSDKAQQNDQIEELEPTLPNEPDEENEIYDM